MREARTPATRTTRKYAMVALLSARRRLGLAIFREGTCLYVEVLRAGRNRSDATPSHESWARSPRTVNGLEIGAVRILPGDKCGAGIPVSRRAAQRPTGADKETP